PKLASQDGWCICHSKRATRSDTRKCRSRAYLVGLQHFRQLPNKSKCGLSCQPPDAPPDLQAECQPPKLLSLLKTHGLSRLERMEGRLHFVVLIGGRQKAIARGIYVPGTRDGSR